jgi:1-acyl-sn-glycerol-3-phosphate acyltransferase
MNPQQPHVRSRVPDGEQLRSPIARWLFLPLRWLYKLWFALVFFGSLVVLYPYFRLLLGHPDRYPRAFRMKRRWACFLQWSLGVPQTVENRGTLPEGPYVICCNHGSYLDIIQMYNLMPSYFLFMGKYELLKWPLFNIFFKGMNIAVNRNNRVEAAMALRKAGEAIDRGTSIALFPEGTIPAQAPRMKSFKDGAFRLAIEKQVPIVPVTFVDHWRLFGEPLELFARARPGRARAVLHPPVPTSGMSLDDVVALRHRVYDIIEAPLLEFAPRHADH